MAIPNRASERLPLAVDAYIAQRPQGRSATAFVARIHGRSVLQRQRSLHIFDALSDIPERPVESSVVGINGSSVILESPLRNHASCVHRFTFESRLGTVAACSVLWMALNRPIGVSTASLPRNAYFSRAKYWVWVSEASVPRLHGERSRVA